MSTLLRRRFDSRDSAVTSSLTSSFRNSIDERYEHLAHTEEGALICWTCASPIANQLRYGALRSEQEAATSDTDVNTNTENVRSHLIRTCNIPDNTIPGAINHDAIAHIRKCVRQVAMNKPHECGLSIFYVALPAAVLLVLAVHR